MQEEIINEIYKYSLYTNNIDIMKSLINNKDKYIYYKTDHHWTSYGAYLGYCDFINSIGDKAISLENLEDVNLLARHFAGWDSDLDEAMLDLNGDGVQNLKDLVLLAQYVAGWDVTLG